MRRLTGNLRYGYWAPNRWGGEEWEWNATGLNMTAAVEQGLERIRDMNSEWDEWFRQRIDPPYREMDVYFGRETAPEWGWPGLSEDRA